MAQLKKIFLLSLLLFFVLISCYFLYSNIFSHPRIAKQDNTTPDIIIHQITSTTFDKQGKVQVTLSAPVMTYSSNNKYSHLTKPKIIVYRKDQSPWLITADAGKILKDQTQYKLIGHVRLDQGHSIKTRAMVITTPELTIYPDKHLAETHQKIRFTQVNKDNSKLSIESIGATDNQKTGQVTLLSHAKGVYNAH